MINKIGFSATPQIIRVQGETQEIPKLLKEATSSLRGNKEKFVVTQGRGNNGAETYFIVPQKHPLSKMAELCQTLTETIRTAKNNGVNNLKVAWLEHMEAIENAFKGQKPEIAETSPAIKATVTTPTPKVESTAHIDEEWDTVPKEHLTDAATPSPSDKKPFFHLPYGLAWEIPGLDRTLESKTPIGS